MAQTNSIKNGFQFVFIHLAAFVIYYIMIVLFGAPLLSLQKETSAFALILMLLTVTPTAWYLGANNVLKIFFEIPFNNPELNKKYVSALELHIKSVLIGSWFGAFLLPLDWDRPWQAWPLPCVMGAFGGSVFGIISTLLKNCMIKSKKKKKKSGTTLKSC